ncbi:MAG: hypothetical protein A3H23_05920 [Planctomycetes bacterium RIFCSPLOWO2_12_FULL_40_19]|nr:MAG: hypothetical protein A3H23_05920 [Planctomycetes bacterium RIFCSPLOWO2_12_FULL_40_19]
MQKFTCFVKEEDGQYASLCLELNVALCGKEDIYAGKYQEKNRVVVVPRNKKSIPQGTLNSFPIP